MPQKFITKNPNRRIIRPSSSVFHNTLKVKEVNPVHNVTKVAASTENKEIKENTEMNAVEQLKNIVGDDAKLPKRKVKVEKKDKGLFERTEDSTILLTEENKMLLND